MSIESLFFFWIFRASKSCSYNTLTKQYELRFYVLLGHLNNESTCYTSLHLLNYEKMSKHLYYWYWITCIFLLLNHAVIIYQYTYSIKNFVQKNCVEEISFWSACFRKINLTKILYEKVNVLYMLCSSVIEGCKVVVTFYVWMF